MISPEPQPNSHTHRLDYARPMPSRRVVSEQSAFGDFGMLSVAAFCVTTVCFVTGAAGMLFDPSVKEDWGGLLYLFLMALPPLFVSPVGLLIGFAALASTAGRSTTAKLGIVLNGVALLAWLGWRLS